MPEVQLPSGETVDIPDGIPPELGARLRKYVNDQKHSTEEYAPPKKKERKLTPEAQRMEQQLSAAKEEGGAGLLKGAGELGLAALTGLGSTIAGGLAGAGRTAYSLASGEGLGTATAKGAETVKSIQQAGTYQPRTATGQLLGSAVGAVGGAPSRMGGALGGAVGEAVGGEKGRVAGEAIGEAAPAIGGAAAGLRGAVKSGARALPEAEVPPIQQAARQAQESGYMVPPAKANPSILNRLVTKYAGEKDINKKLSEANQETTNTLAKRALGLPEDMPITPSALENLRKTAGQAYQAVQDSGVPIKATPKFKAAISDLGKQYREAAKDFPEIAKNPAIENLIAGLSKEEVSATGAVQTVRLLRANAKANLKNFADPEKTALGLAQRNAADALDDLVEQNLSMAGKKDLVGQYKEARQLIAKSHDVEAALNESTGDVNAIQLGRLLAKGKPMTDELRRIAEFGRAFPKAAQPAANEASAMHGSALGTLLGRPAVGSVATTRPYQNLLSTAPAQQIIKKGRAKEAAAAGAPALAAPVVTPKDEQEED